MTENIEKAAKALVAKFLPYMLKRTMLSHYHFVRKMPVETPPESKDHKENQAAGKMAMANIESHLKVAAMISGTADKNSPPPTDLQAILNHPEVQAASAVEEGFDDEEEMV